MLKVPTFSIKGVKKTDFILPKIYESEFNPRLLAQALHVYEERAHVGLAKTKTRAEVARTKKKWYRQKGTGGARHGAKSAPIFVGGGVAHGPQPVKRTLSLPSKMKKKALNIAISEKVRSKELVCVDSLKKVQKTKDVAGLLKKLSKSQERKPKRFTFVFGDESPGAEKSIRNLKEARAVAFKDVNAHDVFYGGILVLDKEVFRKKK